MQKSTNSNGQNFNRLLLSSQQLAFRPTTTKSGKWLAICVPVRYNVRLN